MSVSENQQKHISDSGFYKSFFENHPDAVYVLDLDGNYLDANPACVNVFGHSRDELLNLSFKQIVVPSKYDEWVSKVVSQWHQGQSTTFETTVFHKDGRLVELSVTDTPIIIEGTLIGVFGIAKDITEKKNTEKMLREQKEKYESLKKYNPNGICSLDLSGRVMGANPAYERITGYSLAELRGVRVLEKILHPNDWEWARNTFGTSIVENVEMQIAHKSGRLIDVRVTSVPIIIEGLQTGVYIILQDITTEKKTQNELLQTRELYQMISENSQDIISYSLPDGTFGYVSPSVTPLLGYHPSELTGKSNALLYHPDDLPYVYEIGQRILAGTDVPRFTCRVMCKSGNYLWYETALKVVRNETGEVLQVIGVGRDVSEQMRLQESLEHAVRLAGLGHWEWDIRTGRLMYSDEMFRILGIPPKPTGAFTFEEFTDFVHPEDFQLWSRSIAKALAVGNTFSAVFRIVRQDGSIRYLHSQAELLTDDDYRPVRMVGTAQDISEDKTLELRLQASEHRYHLLVENSRDAIGVIEDGKWVFLNSTGQRLFGLSSFAEMAGRPYRDFVHEDSRSEFEVCLQATLAGDKWLPIEQRFIKADGETFDAEVVMLPLGDATVQVIVRDVTEQKRTYELLLRTEKLSAIGQLAASIAHEIRNPLTALKGFTQMLHETSSGRSKEFLEIMEDELQRIEQILTEMLVLARPQPIEFKSHHVELVLGEVITLLSAQALMQNVLIETDFEENVPMVLGKESQLKQVFLNIIKNGIEAMPKGGVLTVRLRTDGSKVYMEFTDEGEGIPEDRIPKLGEAFFSTKDEGTGLGLLVSHKIVSAHKGEIAISSVLGRGTTFLITLPVAPTM